LTFCAGISGATTSISGTTCVCTTGSKLLSGSNGSFLYMLGLMAWLLATRASMWPSGAALATASVPMMPVAPGLLSMTTAWPQASVSFCPTRRAVMSMAPPGDAGMTMVIDFFGKPWAAS